MREVFSGVTVKCRPDEDGDFLAHLAELPNVSAFAATPTRALEELALAWTAVQESYRATGESVPTPATGGPYD